MALVLPVREIPTLPVEGGGAFPVHRVFGVGRNYAGHAREMGMSPRRAPVWFTKPDTCVVPDGSTVPYPPATRALHHEGELVVALGEGGEAIPEGDALAHVYGFAAGLDLTRRDMQTVARQHGGPWALAKGFDGAAPVGPIRPGQTPPQGTLRLTVNGLARQESGLDAMLRPVAALIATLSASIPLRPGDLLFTGTPSGVGPVTAGDHIAVEVADLPRLGITIGERVAP